MKILYKGRLGPFQIVAEEVHEGEVRIRACVQDGLHETEFSYQSTPQAPSVMMLDLRSWAESRMLSTVHLVSWRVFRDFISVFDDKRIKFDPPLPSSSWKENP